MAIHIKGTTEKIQVVNSAVGTVHITASWTTVPTPITTSSNITPDDDHTKAAIAVAQTTDIVPSPGASTLSNLKELTIANADASVSQNITVQTTNGTNVNRKWGPAAVLAGETLVYDETGKFTLYDSAGKEKLSAGSGALIQSTLLTSGTTFTTNAATRTIRVRGVGGGGGGGGCTSVASAASAAGGGGAGGYAEKTFAVQPNTGYTYAIGAAGAGNSGAAGGNGGNSTFAVGATTVTAFGGTGAVVATAVIVGSTPIFYGGGAGGVVSTNGDLNSGGEPGQAGFTANLTAVGSGNGGSSDFGAGGKGLTAVGAGNAGIGFGAGGGGAATGASTVRTGGAGVAGCWVVDEFT
jgi:hypothetical protein